MSSKHDPMYKHITFIVANLKSYANPYSRIPLNLYEFQAWINLSIALSGNK